MIQFRAIRKAMVEGLAAYLDVKVIEMNSMGKVPLYPFVTYDFTDPAGDSIGFPAVTIEDNQLRHTENVSFTVSFQCYGTDKAGCIELALRVRDWFIGAGHQLLKDTVNVVVTRIGSVDNRDIQLGDEWERRNGLDIDFRTTNFVSQVLEVIETVKIEGVDPIGH